MFFEQKEGVLSLGADFKPICICYNLKIVNKNSALRQGLKIHFSFCQDLRGKKQGLIFLFGTCILSQC
jgi:hypothetical protein